MSATKKILLGTVFIGLLGFAVGVNLIPEYYFKLGMNAYEKGDYQTAYKNFYSAKLIAPADTDYRYYYVQTLTKFKPTVRIQKEMFKFVEDGKDDSAHVAAGIQVAMWKSNINQQYGDNYIEQAPINNQIMRWNPKTFPLKVFVDLQDVKKSEVGHFSRKDLRCTISEELVFSVSHNVSSWKQSETY